MFPKLEIISGHLPEDSHLISLAPICVKSFLIQHPNRREPTAVRIGVDFRICRCHKWKRPYGDNDSRESRRGL